MFGSGTIDKSFGLKDDPLAMYRKKADFAFELMDKLGLDYYCFHDVDIAPEGKTVAESIKYFNEMVDYIAVLQKKHGKKLLWNTANNFGDKKFMAGAATNPNADVFAVAAAKVKAVRRRNQTRRGRIRVLGRQRRLRHLAQHRHGA